MPQNNHISSNLASLKTSEDYPEDRTASSHFSKMALGTVL